MNNCENCTECTEVEKTEKKIDKSMLQIPFIALEEESERSMKRERRLIVALIVAVALLFLSNAAWLWAWMQYDYTSEEIHVDSADGGNANYIGQDGDIYNGTDYGEEESTKRKLKS